jgi:hypothetical protein
MPKDRATGVSLEKLNERVSALVAVIGNDRRRIVGGGLMVIWFQWLSQSAEGPPEKISQRAAAERFGVAQQTLSDQISTERIRSVADPGKLSNAVGSMS